MLALKGPQHSIFSSKNFCYIQLFNCHYYQHISTVKLLNIIRQHISMLQISKIQNHKVYKFLRSLVHNFCDIKIKTEQLIQNCYSNPSIECRVNALKQIPNQLQQQISMAPFTLIMPQFLYMTTTKNLNEFHRNHKTAVNIQILHSLAHIQFNAFIAYADTLFRFGFSKEYEHLWQKSTQAELNLFRTQMKQIATDQGEHCVMLIQRLKQLGVRFGQFPVISNLTNTIYLTDKDIISRLALISIVHQGKGIRSLNRLMDKIKNCNDGDSIKILKIIQSEETFHFDAGLKWFKYFCKQRFEAQQIKASNHQVKVKSKNQFSLFLQSMLSKINREHKVNITLSDIKQASQVGSLRN